MEHWVPAGAKLASLDTYKSRQFLGTFMHVLPAETRCIFIPT